MAGRLYLYDSRHGLLRALLLARRGLLRCPLVLPPSLRGLRVGLLIISRALWLRQVAVCLPLFLLLLSLAVLALLSLLAPLLLLSRAIKIGVSFSSGFLVTLSASPSRRGGLGREQMSPWSLTIVPLCYYQKYERYAFRKSLIR